MPAPSQGPRCLIVEDQALISMLIEEQVEACGYTVAGPFASCQAALDFLRDGTPDLAIIDYLLADGPCLELARELASRSIPFVILSGFDPRAGQNQPGLRGVKWLRKPISSEQLQSVLRDLDPRSPSCRTRTASSFIAPS